MSEIGVITTDVIIGVDTHKSQHVAFAVNALGAAMDRPLTVPTSKEGYAQLLAWASSLGRIRTVGVEGCGSYGQGLARFLRRHGQDVREVGRPPRKAERRRAGKSDAIDAEQAARSVLAGIGTATPKLADGQIESIRLIKIARDTAVKARSAAIISLKAVLVTAPDDLRDTVEKLTDHKLVLACAALSTDDPLYSAGFAARYAIQSLAKRWLALHEEIKTHTVHLKQLTEAVAPELMSSFGFGFDSAAELLVTAGDNTDRIRSEAAFAKRCGVCPIPAGSGRTNGRHRLNRGGNRRANAALYRIVIVRMQWHPPTIAYVQRRTGEGLSKKDIIRCLKRFVAREAFRLLPRPIAIQRSIPAP